MFAGGGEASGPVHIHGRHSELVPPAGPYVGQLDPLLRGLRGKSQSTENPFILTCPSGLV